MSNRYEVWVLSDHSGQWERHTLPFESASEARAWIKRYIPEAIAEVRPA